MPGTDPDGYEPFVLIDQTTKNPLSVVAPGSAPSYVAGIQGASGGVPVGVDLKAVDTVTKGTPVTVTTLATALPSSALASRKSVAIYNNDNSTTLYIGGSDVSTTNGFPIAKGSSMSLDAGPNNAVYGIAASGSINVRVLEIS